MVNVWGVQNVKEIHLMNPARVKFKMDQPVHGEEGSMCRRHYSVHMRRFGGSLLSFRARFMHGMELVSTSWGPVGVEETGEVPWNCP